MRRHRQRGANGDLRGVLPRGHGEGVAVIEVIPNNNCSVRQRHAFRLGHSGLHREQGWHHHQLLQHQTVLIVYSAGLLIGNMDITLKEGRDWKDYVAFEVEVVVGHPAGVHL